MAKKKKERWIIKNNEGRIFGPYTTEKMLYKINQGEINIDDLIANYPGGTWYPISKDPQFYDRLLEAITNEGSEEIYEEHEDLTPMEGSNPSQPSEPTFERELEVEDPDATELNQAAQEELDKKTKIKDSKTKKTDSVIELVDVRKKVKKRSQKKSIIPMILAGVCLFFGLLMFVPSGKKSDRTNLLRPKPNQQKLERQQLKAKIKRGVSFYLQDTYDGYVKAQNELVQAVEGDPRNVEVMSLLCMTYLELWPYSQQDNEDLKTITIINRSATSLDPAGPNGGACRVVDLLVRAKLPEAKSMTETILESYANSAQPPILFYYFKAILLAEDREYQTAVGYLNSAQKLWPSWLRVFSYEANLRLKMGQANRAAKILQTIIKANPKHSESKVLLGIVEYKFFRHYEKARQLLTDGLSAESGAPIDTRSQGFFGLAEIALKFNDPAEALVNAEKSYALNPSNQSAKNLILQLGGKERLKTTKVRDQQLVYEGDQFVREGDCSAAQALYKTAYEVNPKNALAAMKAAKCMWELSFGRQATEWLNKAIKADPKFVEAYVLLADYYTQRYNFLAAARILESASKVAPRSNEVFRGYAIVELRRNNPARSISWAKKALTAYENDVETMIVLTQAYLKSKDFRQAYAQAAKAIEIDQNNRRAQVEYARALAGVKGTDLGIDYLTRLVNNYPLVTEYRLALGKILMDDERYIEAEEVFFQITKIDEKPKEAFLMLGKVLRFQNRLEEALKVLLKASVLDPADARPLYEAGLLYLEVEKPNEAIIQFNRVHRINKRYPLVNYYLGKASMMKKDYKGALKYSEKERSINPNLADSYLLAAEAYTSLKQFGLCAREYQKAIKLRPQGAGIYVKLARCYRLTGNLSVAEAMLKQASVIESGLADIYKEQGAVCLKKGDIQCSAEAYEQYFILNPNAPDKARILREIEAIQKRNSR